MIPPEKEALVKEGYDEVEQIMNNYNMGFITNYWIEVLPVK